LGSTTCDVIPVLAGKPAASGSTDPERLLHGELVYTGVIRSPVCAVTPQLSWRGERCPVAQELFATMRDVYLIVGDLPEEPDCRDTADGRPATRAFATDRLARMVCADRSLFDEADCAASARLARGAQASLIAAAIQRVRARLPHGHAWLISGAGEFLLRRIIDELDHSGRVISLAARLPSCVSQSAPAYAVALLAAEGKST
jgi:probable H4MPT-linked C1 transfer pathway protein